MKKNKIIIVRVYTILLVAIILQQNTGCKKHAHEYTPPNKEKKWMVSTVAGDGRPLFSDGPISTASFRLPMDVAVADDGTLYVADLLNHRVRKIAGGIVSTFAGHGIQDVANGNGVDAGFSFPCRLAFDNTANLCTLDFGDARIRKISGTADVSTYAGTIAKGFRDGPAASAQFSSGFGIASDAHGNLYIGDGDNKRIRKINTNGQVTTIAGTGEIGFKNGNANTATFFSPQGIVIDRQGNLFVADQNRIRKISPDGVVSTFAGSDAMGSADGDRRDASFTLLEDLVIDNQGTIYASDETRIRKITAQGNVTTIAGSTAGFADGEGGSAKFDGVNGLGIDKQGNIYVADANNYRIRKISFE